MKPLVMITGASAGIGEATARAFSAAGHPLLLLARRDDRLRHLDLPDTTCARADVRDREAVEAAIAEGEKLHGPVDLLVNNAGVMPLARLEDQDPAVWRELLDTNCLGMMNCMHALIPAMKARRHGTIVNIGSTAARRAHAGHDAYGASKSFVHALSDAVRGSLAGSGVRVIVVAPGLTTAGIGDTTQEPAGRAERPGDADAGLRPEHVADTLLFAYRMPQEVNLRELTITPTAQSD